jgi:hypothetical protein
MFVGLGTDFWGNAIFVLPKNALILEAEFLKTSIKIFPVILSLLGASLAFILYNFYFKYVYLFKISTVGRYLYTFLNRKWFFDKIYNYVLAHNILTWSYVYTYQNLDRGIFELIGPIGIYNYIASKSNFVVNFYNNNILSTGRIKILYPIFFTILFGTFFLFYWIVSINHVWDVFSWKYFLPSLDKTSFVNFIHEISSINEKLDTLGIIAVTQFPLEILAVEVVPSFILTEFWSSLTNLLLITSTDFMPEDITGLASLFHLFDMHLYPLDRSNNWNPIYPVSSFPELELLFEFVRYSSSSEVDYAEIHKQTIWGYDYDLIDILKNQKDWEQECLTFWKNTSSIQNFYFQKAFDSN